MKIASLLQNLSKPLSASGQNTIQTPKEKSVSESLIEDYNANRNKDVQALFDKHQFKPSPAQVKEVTRFMATAKGAEADKLQTLDTVLMKGIEPTTDNLLTVHQAVTHDTEVIKQLAETPVISATPLTAAETVQLIKAMKIPEKMKAALKQLVNQGMDLRTAVVALGKSLGIDMVPTGQTQMMTTTEALIKLVAEKLIQIDTNATVEPKLSTQSQITIEDMKTGDIPEAAEEYRGGEILVEDGTITKGATSSELAQTTAENSKFHNDDTVVKEAVETVAVEESIDAFIQNAVEALAQNMEEVFGAVVDALEIKTFLVEVTTEATIQAKTDFDTFQTTVKNTLETLEVEMKTTRVTPEKMAADLSKVAEKVNDLILKSNVTLFTDMPTEKKLLLMSAELDQAQTFIKNGEFAKVQNLVRQTLDLLKSIKFDPSVRRVQVFAGQKLDQVTEVLSGESQKMPLEKQILEQLTALQDTQGNRMARDVLETLRYLGLNHEMETAELLDKGTTETTKAWHNSNVKELLLRLMKTEIENRTVAGAEESLMNLSGQQMMNDTKSGQQPFYFFNFPIADGDSLGNMKVIMKGVNRNQVMDWQNAELYFGVDLKSAGKIGIKVKIQDRTVNLELLNESFADISSKLNGVLDDLREFGYERGQIINVDEVAKQTVSSGQNQSDVTRDDQKGFDFKI